MSVAVSPLPPQPTPASDRGRALGDCLVISVVLCCARADAEPIRRVLPGLSSAGLIARVLPGIEENEGTLAEILVDTRVPTVFVICASAAVEAGVQRRLAEAFSRKKGAKHRLIVVELDAEHPHALVTPIRRAADSIRFRLAAARSARARQLEDGARSPHLRDEVGPIPAHIRLPQGAAPTRALRLAADPHASARPVERPVPVRADASAPTPRESFAAVA